MRHTAFYSTAAQIIPVFVLVLAFELRYFREVERESASRSLWLVSLLIALLGGEYLAVTALADDDTPSDFTFAMVAAGLSWGAIGVFVPFFRPRLEALKTTLPLAITRHAGGVAVVYFVAVVVLTGIFDDAEVIPASVALLWLATLLASWSVDWVLSRFPNARYVEDRDVPNRVPNGDDSSRTEGN